MKLSLPCSIYVGLSDDERPSPIKWKRNKIWKPRPEQKACTLQLSEARSKQNIHSHVWRDGEVELYDKVWQFRLPLQDVLDNVINIIN